MKKIILCMLFMLVLSSTALAYDPDPDRWVWRDSNDVCSFYTYNAPPEFVGMSKDRNYIEFVGNILVITPYSDVYRYQARIRVGIKLKEKQIWVEHLDQVGYDKNNQVVKSNSHEKDKLHSVMPDTIEEGYSVALFEAFKEHLKAGSYNKEEPPKEATNKNI